MADPLVFVEKGRNRCGLPTQALLARPAVAWNSDDAVSACVEPTLRQDAAASRKSLRRLPFTSMRTAIDMQDFAGGEGGVG